MTDAGALFPGRVPGQPIDGHSYTNLLNRHGISARPARNGALAARATSEIQRLVIGRTVTGLPVR